MSTHPDTAFFAPPAPWLIPTLRRLGRLPENTSEEKARNHYCRQLIRCIEAEHLNAPLIWIEDSDPTRAVNILFVNDPRQLEFRIQAAGSFLASKYGRKGPPEKVFHRGAPGMAVRHLFGWLYPAANHTSREGMLTL